MATRHDLSFCSCTTACLASELPVYMGHRPHLWILIAKQRLLDQHKSLYGYQTWPVVLCMQNSMISTRNTRLYGSQTLSVVISGKTATFGPEQQVSMGPRYSLSFCTCKTAWLAPELLVSMCPSPHLWFLHAKQRLLDQHTSLYGYQT